ncbi:hypothetical protein DL89DRAFT_224797, partial [Linderina pennispora]
TRKGPLADKRNKLLSRLQAIQREQGELRKSRGKVFDKQASLTTSISRKVSDLKTLKAKSTFKTVSEIDEKIAKNEKRIDSGKLKIIDERRLASENAQLRRARKAVEQCEDAQSTIEKEKAELAVVDAQLADTNAQQLADEYAQLQAELDQIKATQDQGWEKRSGLLDERTRLQKAIDAAWDDKRALQEEHRKQNNDFYKWQQEDRKRRAEEEKQRRIQEQREKRLALAQEQREEAEIPAFQDEINGCDSLIQYLGSFQIKSASNAGSRSEDNTRPSSAASNQREVDSNDHVPAGMVAIKKSSNEESYFAGAAKHKKKAGKKTASKSDALKIPLAVAERFLELKVDLPINMAAIPIALDKLADRKQFFVSNQTKVTEENKKKAEEKIAKLMAELDADEKIAQESS